MQFEKKRKYITILGEKIRLSGFILAVITAGILTFQIVSQIITDETSWAAICGFIIVVGFIFFVILFAGSAQNKSGNLSEIKLSGCQVISLLLFITFFGLVATIFALLGM